MAVLYVNYTKNPDMNYDSVILRQSNGIEHVFNSGNFIKDWFNAVKKFITDDNIDDENLLCSGTVDDFINSNNEYDTAYLILDDNNSGKLLYRPFYKAIEMFVPHCERPTWEELKKLCENE